ncbi:MAG: hypothetical protein A2138_16395 [Deltaproteobacteria bacterium RBG_16_71_12]|nr:MAG: hypothetical protein A2138_16395 [Deltaproteobacteria bacterium RBG_16_71_12]
MEQERAGRAPRRRSERLTRAALSGGTVRRHGGRIADRRFARQHRRERHATGYGLGDRLRRLAGRERDDAVVWEMHDSYSHVHRMPWRVVFDLAA